MKTARKVILTVLCACLLVLASVMGTLAYLTSDDTVTNTFTVGDIKLDLDEAVVDDKGQATTERTTDDAEGKEGNAYHLLPGVTYSKDPTVHIEADSEDCYVRMIVTVENIEQLKDAMPQADYPSFYADDLFLLQNLCVDKDGALTWDGATWLYEGYTEENGKGAYEFRYKEIVVRDETKDTDLPALFTDITVPGSVDNTHLAYLEGVAIVVEAHAIQSAGFANADAAWEAFTK